MLWPLPEPPAAPPVPVAVDPAAADLDACRSLIRTGSRSFFTASLLLPRRVRDPAYALYAFCRLADDAVDETGQHLNEVAGLRQRLDRIYDGRPLAAPADRAFARVVADHAMPKALPAALLEGLQWDADGRRYHTLSELYAYAARVAGSVGAMMTVLMGVRRSSILARACDLGVAMQLTNIARDVGEDARAGRVYLPLCWLREAGIDVEAWLARPAFTPALGQVVDRLLKVADALYRRSVPGIGGLPAVCRPAILAARLLYAEIGCEVARRGHDSVSSRAVVGLSRKLALVSGAAAASPLARGRTDMPALEEVRFLVEAVTALGAGAAAEEDAVAWWQLGERIGRVMELFKELEQRDLATRAERLR